VVDFDTWSRISETLHAYCRAVDEGRVDDFVALYTPDAVHDDGIVERRGHAELRALVAGVVRRYDATSHHLSNIVLTPTGSADAVSAVSYIHAWHRRAGHPDLEVWGQYHDHLRRQGDRWLIERRTLRVAGIRGLDRDPGFHPVVRLNPPEV